MCTRCEKFIFNIHHFFEVATDACVQDVSFHVFTLSLAYAVATDACVQDVRKSDFKHL